MFPEPMPVMFEPLFKRKPWGGQELATLLDKALPPGELIGESWELVSLPGNESVVRGGPLAGRSLHELVQHWGRGLLGDAAPVAGRFPLLVKFLDAREHLSVQVHPKPVPESASWQPGVKHEAWYVLDAEPGAVMFIGVRPGVTLEDVARAANTPGTRELLRSWPAARGDCFYLPSGVVHALGAGLVVAEVQDPSDVTYRLYDWDRVDAGGRRRELHVEQALANVRLDVADDAINQPRRPVHCPPMAGWRIATCERFALDALTFPPGLDHVLPAGKLRVWIVLSGGGAVFWDSLRLEFRKGDTVLVPAGAKDLRLGTREGGELLQVTLPQPQRQ